MDDSRFDNLVRDLVRLLTDLREHYGQMVTLTSAKLEAMRKADTDALQSIVAQEMVMANRGSEREGLRRQITERIAASLGIDRARARSMRVAELAEYLAEPRRSQLLTAATGLRATLAELSRQREVTTLVTREMLLHVGEVIAVMRSGGVRADVYSRGGRPEAVRPAHVFEAVG